MSSNTSRRRWPLLLPPLLWQLTFFLLPLLFLFVISFWSVVNFRLEPDMTLKNWDFMLSRSSFWSAYGHTWALALGAAVVTTCCSFPAACSLAFTVSERTRKLALMFLVVPFFTSYLVRVYSWQAFLADNGIVNALLSVFGIETLPMLNSDFGSLVGYVTLALPLVTLVQTMGLAQIDRNLIEAAHNLRAGPVRTLFEVIIPLAKPSLVVGALFAFILAFGDFVAPTYLGGGAPPTLSNLIIDTTKSGQQWPRAAVVAIMMILTLVVTSLAAVRLAYGRRK